MENFTYHRPTSVADAVKAIQADWTKFDATLK